MKFIIIKLILASISISQPHLPLTCAARNGPDFLALQSSSLEHICIVTQVWIPFTVPAEPWILPQKFCTLYWKELSRMLVGTFSIENKHPNCIIQLMLIHERVMISRVNDTIDQDHVFRPVQSQKSTACGAKYSWEHGEINSYTLVVAHMSRVLFTFTCAACHVCIDLNALVAGLAIIVGHRWCILAVRCSIRYQKLCGQRMHVATQKHHTWLKRTLTLVIENVSNREPESEC